MATKTKTIAKKKAVNAALGIDIGGSGIKGAPVDVDTGVFLKERLRLPTPRRSNPLAVIETVQRIVEHFEWSGPIGCGFPGVTRDGVILTAANMSKRFIGLNLSEMIEKATGNPVAVGNDADVAGLAEVHFGAGREKRGSVLVVTLGTGIGSALFVDGRLVPNLEFGHLEVNGKEAEVYASDRTRQTKGLSWKKWAKRLDTVLERYHAYLWPEQIIVGGGISKKHEDFLPFLTVPTEVVPAQLRNDAGIIGAALLAAEMAKGR
jgi:polyphosphate glucokinase